MERIRYCDGKRLKKAILAGTNWLNAKREYLDRINLFPVQDFDTGTNMCLTLNGVTKRLNEVKDNDLVNVLKAITEESLISAKGNSGVILSQFFRGFSEGVQGKRRLNSTDLASALENGARLAYKVVKEPKEGTILTVMREIAEYANSLSKNEVDLANLLPKILSKGKEVLKQCPSLLPELKGEIDAGGAGFLALFEGIERLIRGEVIEEVALPEEREIKVDKRDISWRYCTEFLIEGEAIDLERIKEGLAHLGGSLIVAGGETLVRVHIHTNNPHLVIDRCKEVGEVKEIKMDDMIEQQKDFIEKNLVKIVTDSTCDIPQSLIEKYNITVVPLYVEFNGQSFRDGIDISPSTFYEKLVEGKGLPKTSQPAPQDFVETYKGLENQEIISIHISSKMSGTYQTATLAKSLVSKNIEVIDSRLTSMGLGMVALLAAKASKEGKGKEEIIKLIHGLIPKVKVIFTVDTLEYLEKGGRIGKAKELLGTLFNLKPILSIKDGEVVPIGVARGKKRVLQKLIKLIKDDVTKEIRCAIMHGNDEESALRLKEEILRNFKCSEIIISEIGPVIGAHVGPGALGVVYLEEG